MRPFNTPFILWPSAGRRPKNVPFIPAFQASLTEPRPQRVVSVPSTATLTGSRQGRGMQTRTGTRCSQNICACGVSLTFSQHLWVSAFHIILFWSGKFSCGEHPPGSLSVAVFIVPDWSQHEITNLIHVLGLIVMELLCTLFQILPQDVCSSISTHATLHVSCKPLLMAKCRTSSFCTLESQHNASFVFCFRDTGYWQIFFPFPS